MNERKVLMRLAGRLKLGFYPLPTKEAQRIRACLQYLGEFAALDPVLGMEWPYQGCWDRPRALKVHSYLSATTGSTRMARRDGT